MHLFAKHREILSKTLHQTHQFTASEVVLIQTLARDQENVGNCLFIICIDFDVLGSYAVLSRLVAIKK